MDFLLVWLFIYHAILPHLKDKRLIGDKGWFIFSTLPIKYLNETTKYANRHINLINYPESQTKFMDSTEPIL